MTTTIPKWWVLAPVVTKKTKRDARLKGKKMKDIDIAKDLGRMVGMGMPLVCPVCVKDKQPNQLISSFGDSAERLFCPHCEMELDIVIRYNPDE